MELLFVGPQLSRRNVFGRLETCKLQCPFNNKRGPTKDTFHHKIEHINKPVAATIIQNVKLLDSA